MQRHDIEHTQLVHMQPCGRVKCVVAAYLLEERGAQDSSIYLVGVVERLTEAFHLLLEHLLRKRLC